MGRTRGLVILISALWWAALGRADDDPYFDRLLSAATGTRESGPLFADATPQKSPLALPTPVREPSFLRAQFAVPTPDMGAEASPENDDDDSDDNQIRDHGFLVEEAVNQEPGYSQHTSNWIFLQVNRKGTSKKDFVWSYTLDMPLWSQKHQLSFATLFVNTNATKRNGETVHSGGVGDSFLSYRYQLLASDEFLWAAPRFTLILPSGSSLYDTGAGAVGYQVGMPVSHYGKHFDFHLNAGFTDIPGGRPPGFISGARTQNIEGYNFGASVYWKPTADLNLFLEALVLRNYEFDAFDLLDSFNQVFLNPGFRYAIINDPAWWVVGVSFPVGLNSDAPHFGTFIYMSVEHSFRKKRPK